jgi:hypothetical protein
MKWRFENDGNVQKSINTNSYQGHKNLTIAAPKNNAAHIFTTMPFTCCGRLTKLILKHRFIKIYKMNSIF